MGINVSKAIIQARELGNVAQHLTTAKKRLTSLKSDLQHNWKATEIAYINSAIDQITKKLQTISSQLDSLESKVIYAANEIKREEEAEARRIAAAKEAAAREAEAKAKAEREAAERARECK